MVADIIAYNLKGQPTLTVEVKNKSKTTTDWATQLRRNILSHGALPDSKYFLLALPDKFYLWKDSFEKLNAKPDYVENPKPFLSKYYSKPWDTVKLLSEDSFEMIISSWLRDLIHSDIDNDDIKRQKWLVDSGLYKSLKGGYLMLEDRCLNPSFM